MTGHEGAQAQLLTRAEGIFGFYLDVHGTRKGDSSGVHKDGTGLVASSGQVVQGSGKCHHTTVSLERGRSTTFGLMAYGKGAGKYKPHARR